MSHEVEVSVPGEKGLLPFSNEMLDVGDGHSIYVEQVGSPGGVPVVFLHGGPGSGCQLRHRHLFDPERYRTILFDQRGAGRSRPYLSFEANTTQQLVADMERIRRHLGLERWLIVGGSWGSTLALAYAERFPKSVSGLVLRAVFLGTEQEVDWAFMEGPKQFRPELFEELSNFLLPSECDDVVASFMRRLTNPHPPIHAPAAAVWYAAERVLSRSNPSEASIADNMPPKGVVPPTPLMEAHYFELLLPRPRPAAERCRSVGGDSGHHRSRTIRPALSTTDGSCARQSMAGGATSLCRKCRPQHVRAWGNGGGRIRRR